MYFDPYEYNNNVYVDDKLHVVCDSNDLLNLIDEKMGRDSKVFIETIINEAEHPSSLDAEVERETESIEESYRRFIQYIFEELDCITSDESKSKILKRIDEVKDKIYREM